MLMLHPFFDHIGRRRVQEEVSVGGPQGVDDGSPEEHLGGDKRGSNSGVLRLNVEELLSVVDVVVVSWEHNSRRSSKSNFFPTLVARLTYIAL